MGYSDNKNKQNKWAITHLGHDVWMKSIQPAHLIECVTYEDKKYTWIGKWNPNFYPFARCSPQLGKVLLFRGCVPIVNRANHAKSKRMSTNTFKYKMGQGCEVQLQAGDGLVLLIYLKLTLWTMLGVVVEHYLIANMEALKHESVELLTV